jgi:hypothetical protein
MSIVALGHIVVSDHITYGIYRNVNCIICIVDMIYMYRRVSILFFVKVSARQENGGGRARDER